MSTKKLKIMFVCLGNICRSPAAHAVLEHKVRERGLEDRIQVSSSGTSAYHVGEEADPRMRNELSEHGVSSPSRAQQFHKSDFEYQDLILAMDRENFSHLRQSLGNGTVPGELTRKLRMFRNFDPEGTGDVPDPYYGGSRGFTEVYAMVERTVERILDVFEAGELDAGEPPR